MSGCPRSGRERGKSESEGVMGKTNRIKIKLSKSTLEEKEEDVSGSESPRQG